MPTPAIFRHFDDLHLCSDLHPIPDWTNLTSSELLPHLINDLETPAFSLQPKLKEIKDFIESTLSRIVRMTGSGSTLFTLYDEPDEPKSMALKVNQALNLRAIPVELAPVIRDDLHENLATQ
jgi:4-diphosphocytidyl-2C-methyl-D-erythritol kinase